MDGSFDEMVDKVDRHYEDWIKELMKLKEQKISKVMELKQYYNYRRIVEDAKWQDNERNIQMIQKDIDDNFDQIIANEFQMQDFDRVIRGYMDRLNVIQNQIEQVGCCQQMF